jgi:hypothetical protein
MSTCVNCYNTSTAAPCASVGCLSTNYGKCITYSGPTLTCEYGGIGTFTFTGTSAGATSGTLIFNSVGGSGSGATFAVTTTLGSPIYTVQVVNPGSGYTEGDILTIPFTFANALSSNWEDITASWEDILDTFGGTSSPVNDITITVVAVSGVLTNGENIDDVIINLHERICLISSNGVQGLDYSGFNYACLRQNGVLTGVGTAITTAREFTESVAAALCNIDPRVTSVEKPNITVPSCFTSTITSGVTGLSSILSQYGSMLCTHNTNLNMTSVGGNPCLTYSFTAKPTSNNVYEYINWITTNMCTIQSDLTNSISAQSTLIATLYSYITGSPTGTVPSVVDTSCLAGGSATSSLKNAVVLIKDRLCALTTTVTGLSNPTYTVAWACFATSSAGGMIANSPYSSLAAFSSTATITAHLNNISAALNALRMKFSLAEFVLAPNSSTACGTYWDITLKPGNAADFFVYDGAWVGKSLNVTLNGSSSGVTKSVTSGAVNFDLTVASLATTVSNLSISGGTSWSFPLAWSSTGVTGGTIINNYPAVYRNNGIVTIGNNTAGGSGTIIKIAVGSSGTFPAIGSGTQFTVCTIPTTYRPAQSMGGVEYISGTIIKSDSSHNVVATYPVIIQVDSGTGTLIVRFVQAITSPASTDYFMLPLGGISWSV